MTFRAIHSVMPPTAGPALEKSAPFFMKMLRLRYGRRLLGKLCHALFELAVFFLQLRELIFQQNKLLLQERDVLFKDNRRTVLDDKALDLGEEWQRHEKPNADVTGLAPGKDDK